jgi:NADH-quinone oxidoreductase subunit A
MWVTPAIMLQAFDPGIFAANWTAVALSAVVAAAAILGMFATSRILSSRRPSEIKLSPYECGIPPTPYNWSNINVRFYIFAILFLIFDVEAVFLFPWAVIFMHQKVVEANAIPFYAMMLFLGVLFFAIVYAWKKGALEWQR